MKTVRIGSGAGYSGDRIEPMVELAEKGDIQYLALECLAERIIAIDQQARLKDPELRVRPAYGSALGKTSSRLPEKQDHDYYQYGRRESCFRGEKNQGNSETPWTRRFQNCCDLRRRRGGEGKSRQFHH
jgi:hypothetical protein